MRDLVLGSTVRVFEQTPVTAVHDGGDSVRVETPGGTIRASKVLLTANAFMNGIGAAPRNLSTPVYVTAVETEPISSGQLDQTGWTSRLPLLTTHLVMESYRTTSRGTIVVSTRKIETARQADESRKPTPGVAEDLIRGFRDHFPTLGGVAVTRTWGGWIGMTPANLAVAGKASPRVFYSMACNGHGLPQAPYLGSLVADHMAGASMHDDLAAMWRDKPTFAPGVVNPATVRLGWLADRVTDRWARLRG
jgi:glycine/D-amino acid oxidase-like deaminating enzyme